MPVYMRSEANILQLLCKLSLKTLPLPSFHKTMGVVTCCELETGLLLPGHIQHSEKSKKQ